MPTLVLKKGMNQRMLAATVAQLHAKGSAIGL